MCSLHKNASPLETFLVTFQNIFEAGKEMHRHQKNSSHWHKLCENTMYMYKWVIVNRVLQSSYTVLMKQISKPRMEEIVEEHFHSTASSQPINAATGREAFKVVKKEMKASASESVPWKNAATSSARSAVGWLQLYSDKSQTSMSPRSLVFAPKHGTQISFLEGTRKR